MLFVFEEGKATWRIQKYEYDGVHSWWEKSELIVATLVDNSGNSSHAVEISLDTRLVYDCKERFVLKLGIMNFSICCSQNKVFDRFSKVGELWNQNPSCKE